MFEHAIVALEGRLDVTADDLAAGFMSENGEIARKLDDFAGSSLPLGGGWELVSHAMLRVDERLLLTFVFRRPALEERPQ